MDKFVIDSQKEIDLKTFDPEYTDGTTKCSIEEKYLNLQKKFVELQNVFYASKKFALLIILQGMDCSGKDGTVKKALGKINPNGFRVESFKEPNKEELLHDYLWRIHKVTPQKGTITVFNRSYYEDVLVTRVHGTINDDTAFTRFKEINMFEKFLVNNGTLIIKFFLHISKDFQKKKLEERLEIPQKRWKFSDSDLAERKYWNNYQKCYGDVLSNCSTKSAPWYIVPSNKRWFRDYIVLDTIVSVLGNLNLKFPDIDENIRKLMDELRKSN